MFSGWESFLVKTGGGSAAGLICGVLAKQFIKLLAFLLGCYTASLAYLQYRGYITVYWGKVTRDLFSLSQYIHPVIDRVLSFGVITGSFIAGFYLGFRKS